MIFWKYSEHLKVNVWQVFPSILDISPSGTFEKGNIGLQDIFYLQESDGSELLGFILILISQKETGGEQRQCEQNSFADG